MMLEEPAPWIRPSLHAEHEITVARKRNEYLAEALMSCRYQLDSTPHGGSNRNLE